MTTYLWNWEIQGNFSILIKISDTHGSLNAGFDHFFRVINWIFMSSPWPTACICVLYYFIIRIVGPRFMRNREPYNIYKIQIVYNLVQTLLSAWIWIKFASFWLTGKYNWICQPVDYSGKDLITFLNFQIHKK